MFLILEMKNLGLPLILTIAVSISYAQQRTISGIVTSAVDGKPVDGVKVVLVGEKIDTKRNNITFFETKIKTKTNEKGQYKFTVPDTGKNIIRFKKRPYSTIDVELDNKTQLDLQMTLPLRQNK
jgi:hypothetical protein